MSDKAGSGTIKELLFVESGVKGEIKLLQGFKGWEAGFFESGFEQIVSAAAELIVNEQFQELNMAELRGDGLLISYGQGLDHACESEGA